MAIQWSKSALRIFNIFDLLFDDIVSIWGKTYSLVKSMNQSSRIRQIFYDLLA